MTYAASISDFYDDGLVHAHEWSRATPPGGHHKDNRHGQATIRPRGDNDDRDIISG